jgi:hypothetical protein
MRELAHVLKAVCLTAAGAVVFSFAAAAEPQSAEQVAQEIQQAIEAAGADWTVAVTWVSRLSTEEKRALCGDLDEEVPDALKQALPAPKGVLPTHFDWRDSGGDWTTPIRDQGGCGSCWDFAATGVFESLLNIDAANPALDIDLSEQYVLSCCATCGDCGGGSSNQALDFYCTTGGVTEPCLPYQADDTVPCGDACVEPHIYLGDWAYIVEDVEAIKSAIYYYGPICASFEVYDDFFDYFSGIYKYVWGDYAGGHAISIVGWDDTGEYWICKNSWGTDWGETTDGNPHTPGAGDGGWFRICWGECDIEGRRTVAATMTTWPSGTIDVTVLDGAGVGVDGAEIYVDGDYHGATAPDGTLALDLVGGMYYDVTAHTYGQFLLYDTVLAPGSLVLDCRTASHVSVSTTARDGTPLDGEVCFLTDNFYFPGDTTGGSGSFYITPGVYDYQFWGWHGTECYTLAFPAVDLTESTGLTIDCTTIPLTEWRLDLLADSTGGPYDYVSLGGRPSGFGGWVNMTLEQGDSALYNAGDWRIYYRLKESQTPPYEWSYRGDHGWLTFTGGEVYPIEAGGDLTHLATPEMLSYLPGGTAEILVYLSDAFGNSFYSVYRYDTTGAPPPDSLPGGSYELIREGDESPDGGSYDYFYPWLTVTPPTDPAIFDAQVYLADLVDVAIGASAQLGAYTVRSTIDTHLGELEGLSSFGVGLGDPYEPNDPCEAAYDLGLFLPGDPPFASLEADHVDPNLDWFSVDVGADGRLLIETALIGSTCDTKLWLYDACGGTQLAYDDDGGVGWASRILYVVSPGTYVFVVDQYGQDYGPDTEYTFTVELLPPPGPDPYEPNEPCDAAHSLGSFLPGDPPFTSAEAQHIDPNLDWFSVEVGAEGTLVIETAVLGDECDTTLTLYDACGGAELSYDNNSGAGDASRILYVVSPGTYYFVVDQYDQYYGPETEYTFTVELLPPPPPDPYEPNEPCDAAHSLGSFLPGDPPFTSAEAHHIDPNLDWFSVEVGAEGTLVIETAVLGDECDTTLTLYDACGGAELAYNDDWEDLESRIAIVVSPGTCYFVVDQYDQYYGLDTEYTFTVELQPPPAPDPYDPNQTCGAAYDLGPLPLDPPFISAVAHFAYGAYDWFAFSIDAAALLEIETELIGPDVDTELSLFDTCSGSMLAFDDDGGEGSASWLVYLATPGTYYLRVEEDWGNTAPDTEYRLTIGKLPMPRIGVVGPDPLIVQVPPGTTTILDGLLEVANVGEEGTELDYRILWQEIPAPPPVPPAPDGEVALALPELPGSKVDPGKPDKSTDGAGPPTGDWELLWIDPQDEPGSRLDLAELHAQIDGTTLYFRGVTYTPWSGLTDMGVYIHLDVDQNPATGGYFPGVSGLGVEYSIVWPYGYVVSETGGGSFYVDYISAVPDANEFVVGVDLTRLWPDAGAGGIALSFVGIDDAVTFLRDDAPDSGSVCYPLEVPTVSCVPDFGTVAGGNAAPIGLQVDATGMSEGESCLIRLYFMSNDTTAVLTRDVEFRVEGTTPAVFRVDADGHMYLDGTLYSPVLAFGSADVAEWVNVSEPVEPGDVLEFDPESPGQYRKARGPCSPYVAGVVSTEPGVVLGEQTIGERALLALVGIVPVKACDEGGPIGVGDLLVTASIPGYVRRWNPETDWGCPIVGKALAPLAQGESLVLALLVR